MNEEDRVRESLARLHATGNLWNVEREGLFGRTFRPGSNKLGKRAPIINKEQAISAVIVGTLVLLLMLFLRFVIIPEGSPPPFSIMRDWVTIGFVTLGSMAITRYVVSTSGVGGSVRIMGSFSFRLKMYVRAYAPEWFARLFRIRRIQLGHVVSCYPSPSSGQNGENRVAVCYFTHGFRPLEKYPSPENPKDNLHILDPEKCGKAHEPMEYTMRCDEGDPAPYVRRMNAEESFRVAKTDDMKRLVERGTPNAGTVPIFDVDQIGQEID